MKRILTATRPDPPARPGRERPERQARGAGDPARRRRLPGAVPRRRSTPTRRPRPAPPSPSAASPRCSTPATATSRRCPTTASATRPTRARSSCASTRSGRRWKTECSGRATCRSSTRSRSATPTRKVPFPIVNENTAERILTGGDFDIESVRQRARRHVLVRRGVRPVHRPHRRRGRVLDAPVPLPARLLARQPVPARPHAEPRRLERLRGAWRSPRTARRCTRSSRAPLVGDDPLVRHVYEFDVSERRYTGRNWIYRMTHPGHARLRRRRLRQRPAHRHRARQRPGPGRGLEEGVRDRRPGNRAEPGQKREIVDLLDVNDKDGISREPDAAPATSASATRSSSRTRPSRPCSRCPATSSRSSTTPISGRPGGTRTCRTTATSSSSRCPASGLT